MSQILMIGGVSVCPNNSGLYCLYDIHCVTGGERRYELTLWRNLQQANELGQLLSDIGISVTFIKSQPYFFKLKFSEHLRLLDTLH